MTPSGKLPSDDAQIKGDDNSGLVRLIEVALRRHGSDADGSASARMLMTAAIALYAEHATPGDVALLASETVATLAQRNRRRGLAG